MATPFVILHRMAKSSGFALLLKILTAAEASLTLTQAWLWPLSRTWNGLSWTLSVEVFCYLLFPWIAAKLRTLREAELIALAGPMWICAMLPPAVWHFVPALPEFFVLDDPLFHLPTFVAGAAVGFLFLRRKLSGAQASLCSASGLAIILAVTAFSKSIAPGFLHNGFLIPGFCLLIYGLACNGWPAARQDAVGSRDAVTGRRQLLGLHSPVLRLVDQLRRSHRLRAYRLHRRDQRRRHGGQRMVLPSEQRDPDHALNSAL